MGARVGERALVAEFCDKEGGVVEEGERPVVVGEGGARGSSDTRPHGGGNGWVGAVGGGFIGRVGGGRRVGHVEFIGCDGGCRRGGVDGGARKLEDEAGGAGTKERQTRVEGGEVTGFGGNSDVGEAVLLLLGSAFAIGVVEDGGGGITAGVEEFGGFMGDSRVAGFKEGFTERVTEEVTFGINGVEIDRDVLGEGIEDGARGKGSDMGFEGGSGLEEGYFLLDRFTVVGGERGKGNGGRLGARGDSDGCKVGGLGGTKGGINGGGGVLGHGKKNRE